MKKKLFVLFSFFGLTPMLAFAASGCTALTTGSNGSTGTLTNVLCTIGNFLNSVVPVLIALGVVYFVWGVITYVISSDEEAKTTGRMRMIYGIIGLAVIVGMWGLVSILGNTFGVNNGGGANETFPSVPLSSQ